MSLLEHAYAQTRLQARHGMRPDEALWQQLEGVRDPGAYLQRARNSTLREWVQPLRADTDAHAVERELRRHLRAYVTEIACWLPARWRASVRWTEALIDLPLVDGWLRGEALPESIGDDPHLAPLARVRPAAADGEPGAAAYGPLRGGRPGPALLEAWLAEWRRRWPAMPARERAGLEGLAALVEALRRDLDDGRQDGLAAARSRLGRALARTFRREARRPAAVFAHLGLIALDVGRLRGDLLTRAIFRETPS